MKKNVGLKRKYLLFISLIFISVLAYVCIEYADKTKKDLVQQESAQDSQEIDIINSEEIIEEIKIENKLQKLPEEIRALYLTARSAGNSEKIDEIINLMKKEKLNAVTIDIKDYSGYVSYKSEVEEVLRYEAEKIMINDIDALIKKLHDNNIYAIARITVFQDPVLAEARPDFAVKNKATGGIWKDNKGLAWIDPASIEAWDYIIKIAQEASKKGFDEINFDYIRFPSDGLLSNMSFPFYNNKEKEKHEVIREFFSYLNVNLTDIIISADLFGLAAINKDDLGIGQVIEDAYDNFDYVSPMVYPSHYASGFIGYKNPAEFPYEVVKYSIEKAKTRLDEFNRNSDINKAENKRKAKLRPWLQAFNMGAVYGADKVKAQIKASNESGGVGWILWNSSNNYSAKIKNIND
jgi:hypothetical protein